MAQRAQGGQLRHEVSPDFTHDEQSRQQFIQSIKVHIAKELQPAQRAIFDARVEPAFRRDHNRSPENVHEVRGAMMRDSYTQMWSALKRDVQEQMFYAVAEGVERQLPELVGKTKKIRDRANKLGSLTLDPSVRIPRYNSAVDIHCKPGGYHAEVVEDDVLAGAEFERTLHLHLMGLLGPHDDDMGQSLACWAKQKFPTLKPRRILDMGCTIGNSTLPWLDEYPDAEMVAIDVSAPVLRYGHARSESMGKPVQFVQMDAEHTSFPDSSFDFVVSHILMHETSNRALRNIFRESHRLLRPGGVMLHLDGPQYHDMEPIDQFIPDWDVHYNNEPFITTLHQLDLPAVVEEAGFEPGKIFEDFAPSQTVKSPPDGYVGNRRIGNWYLVGAQK
jgi:SAM-dependent methyltransferase